ncbi:MAG: zinc-ribbon domain-containing protein [Promethearchaeati archaeon SRVP18_Atabeyarchaeia-1]
MSANTSSDGRNIESDILVAIFEHEGQRVQLSELAEELSVDEEELRSIIVKLTAKIAIKIGFDKDTGELVIGEYEAETIEQTPNFCAYCSNPLPEGARFCPSCGSSVQ